MNFEARRKKIYESMEKNSVAILYSGIEMHISADSYELFQSNRNFFYLTGLRREKMALVLDKSVEPVQTILFIEEAEPLMVRWTGKRVSKEEAKEISGIDDIRYIADLDAFMDRKMAYEEVENLYFDTYRYQAEDLPDYNVVKANEYRKLYPGVQIKNLYPFVAALRMKKDEEEVALTRKAIALTDEGLKNVLRNLKPGMKEYQAQADFEYSIRRNGAESPAFFTIAGSGANGCMLHYETNQDTIADNTLILLDLGARVCGYNSDITRTYPANGKFTEKQKKVYDIVLEANRVVGETAKPGMTLKELNEVCKKVLAEGLISLGLIKEESEVGKYYMHGVSHHLGIDVHDVTVPSKAKLEPGCIITNEPGLYIDEWEIGIRIEDDLLITENGCEVLSKDIMRTTEEIEDFMAKAR